MCSPFPRARMGSIFVQLLNHAPTGNWARGGQVAGKRPYLRSGRSVVRTIIAIRKLDGNIGLEDKRVRRLKGRANRYSHRLSGSLAGLAGQREQAANPFVFDGDQISGQVPGA